MALYRFSPGLDPVRGLLTLQQALDRVFDKPTDFDLGPSGRGVFPPMNVFTNDDGCVVKMEMPGVKAETLEIESHGRTLTVRGTREENVPEGGSFHRRERESGAFGRSVQLPSDLDLPRADAKMKGGLLTITIPKHEAAKPRQIAVTAA